MLFKFGKCIPSFRQVFAPAQSEEERSPHRAANARIAISEPESFPDFAYKPSVDVTFDSIADIFSNRVLAIILTGMGADGLEGCKALKTKNATIWAQDKQSCVVYGMPQAVTVANVSEENFDIEQMAQQIKNEILD